MEELKKTRPQNCYAPPINRGRISSVGRAFDCRAGGRGFNSRGRTNTQGLKKNLRNEGNTFALQMARPSRGSDDHVKWWSRLQ